MPTSSGGYPDPSHDAQARFFDGRAWTRWTVGIPVVGALWAFIELGFVPGTGGPNVYGKEPS